MKKQKCFSICLTEENWQRIANSLNCSNYCITKNFNGKKHILILNKQSTEKVSMPTDIFLRKLLTK